MRLFLKILFWILFAILCLISLHSIFNGGIDNMIQIIKQDGFFEFIKQFFVEIWTGFKTTIGL